MAKAQGKRLLGFGLLAVVGFVVFYVVAEVAFGQDGWISALIFLAILVVTALVASWMDSDADH